MDILYPPYLNIAMLPVNLDNVLYLEYGIYLDQF